MKMPIVWLRPRTRGRRSARGRHSRLVRAILGLASLALLVVAVITLATTAAVALRSTPVTSAAPSQATVAQDDWIPLRSTSLTDVLAAVRESPLLDPSNGQTLDLSRLGTPLLVHGLAAHNGSALPDAYVIPALDRFARAQGAVEAELKGDMSALHVDGIITFTHAQPATITRMSAAAAARLVSRARHVGVRADTAPQLVYFPVDAEAQIVGRVKWSAGGEYPADPIWCVPGADNVDYFVGTNGAVYTLSQLPIAAHL